MTNRLVADDPAIPRRPADPPGAGAAAGRLVGIEDFGPNPGRLSMSLHVPPVSAGGPMPVVVVLHGCLQNAAAYDRGSGWSDMATRLGFVVIYAEQQKRNNPNVCFNWFLRSHTSRGLGEAASVRQMIEHAAGLVPIDRSRIYVTGLSAGGAMTAALLASYPEVFAAGAILAGLPFRAATTLRGAIDVMAQGTGRSAEDLADAVRQASDHGGAWPRVAVWHGLEDRTVSVRNADDLLGQWRTLHGLPPDPTETARVGTVLKRVWRDGDGRPLLEDLRVEGLGHGAPVTPTGASAGGDAYFLEAPVSSTVEIARFFGFDPPADIGLPPGGSRPIELPTDLIARIGGYLRRVVEELTGRRGG